MILSINTLGEEATVSLHEGGKEVDRIFWTGFRQLHLLVSKVEELAGKHGLEVKDIKGVVVYRGPGSFTAVRIGAVVANSLAAGLNIPVSYYQRDEQIADGILRLKKQKIGSLVMPLYDREPNITHPKPKG